MPFTAPTFLQASHSILLNYALCLSPPFEKIVKRLSEAASASEDGKPTRPDVLKGTTDAMAVILGNLLRAHYRDPNLFVGIPLANGRYSKNPLNRYGLGIRAVKRAVHYLQNATPNYVETAPAHHKKGAVGRATGLRSTKRLIDELEDCLSDASADEDTFVHLPLKENTFSKLTQMPVSQVLYGIADLPVLRLKSEKAKYGTTRYVSLPDIPEVAQIESNLARYNDFLADHWVDLLIPDEDFMALQHRSRGEADEYFGDKGREIELDLIFKRQLHRVFNNGTITHGGRFYGGWWQNIPSEYRQAITINWHTTVEIDYSSMHPHMLYALEGKQAPEDCYALEGFPKEHRKLLKTTFQKLVNATGRIQPPDTDTLPEGWTWEQIVDGLCKLHEPISRHFQSGKGVELQRIDSDIAEQVMLRMMDKGLLALPVHDSFIVWDTKANLLREVMLEAYRERMGREIGMKADAVWIEKNIPPDMHELHEDGVYHIEDAISVFSDGPEFEGYRLRRKYFMEWMGEEWGHRHSFLI